MNTHTNDHDPDTPEAVRDARAGAKAWRAAVLAQRMAVPDHADFYTIAGEVVDTLTAVAGLAEVLAWQVAHYGDNRPVYDDSRVVDPHERLDAAALDLRELGSRLRAVEDVANAFWSRIGHIGVDTSNDPAPTDAHLSAEVAR
ncbi:hypothetical protein PSU4_23370 [Pseudonocardia sulfidoxydans NBRC 16205]|uniref:Uncharacterized protein n=1 Tax=Pseudonocardia sulfidoxydans NBRC 16205 TaxID=1223511 RepID=A0A511DG63_9PSEU|nr:hypothetical protein [Pseudonocardia sulfidoxydans]GEL23383.1 hypothetical protein PSU4_23370 [Pseudonocardia sulfidoxydans NBRC 16205]